MGFNWNAFLEGLDTTSQNVIGLLMKEHERKKDMADYKEKQKYTTDLYADKQQDILDRQIAAEKYKNEWDSFEDTFGKDPYIRQMYEESQKGDPAAQARWMGYEDIKRSLAQYQPLDEKQNEAFKALPGSIQTAFLTQIQKNQEHVDEIKRTKESHTAQMKNYESLGESREASAKRGAEYLQYRKDSDVTKAESSINKSRHGKFEDWKKEITKLDDKIFELKKQMLSVSKQASGRNLDENQKMSIIAQLENLGMKKQELSAAKQKLVESLPDEGMGTAPSTRPELSPEDELEIQKAIQANPDMDPQEIMALYLMIQKK